MMEAVGRAEEGLSPASHVENPAMTPKEIVRRAVRFEGPPRLAVQIPEFGIHDVALLPVRGSSAEVQQHGADEWGCVWGHTNADVDNIGYPIGHPLEDLRRLDHHPMPDYRDDRRYEHTETALRGAEEQGQYVLCPIFMVLFERMHALHGFENTLADLYDDRPAMAALADRIVEVHVTLVQQVCTRFAGRVDGFRMSDDWGTQQGPFIPLDLWREFFLPRYRRIFDRMHEAGCDVWVHCCGKVNEIIEGFIEAGVNVINLAQPRALGIEEIGDRYRGRIAFEGVADIQSTLPTGDARKIEADVDSLMTHWANRRGGFVLKDYYQSFYRSIGADSRVATPIMYEAFNRWSKRLYGEPLPPRGQAHTESNQVGIAERSAGPRP